MGIVEEVHDRFLFTHLDVCSFYEALGRVAEYLRIPNIKQLSQLKTEYNKLITIELYFDMEELTPIERNNRIKSLFYKEMAAV